MPKSSNKIICLGESKNNNNNIQTFRTYSAKLVVKKVNSTFGEKIESCRVRNFTIAQQQEGRTIQYIVMKYCTCFVSYLLKQTLLLALVTYQTVWFFPGRCTMLAQSPWRLATLLQLVTLLMSSFSCI